MIDQLFGSKTRVKLLQLFFTNPNRPFYVREITRKIEEQINSVRRELANLLDIGIISSENTNNRLYYEVNQTYQYYSALGAMFGGKRLAAASKKSSKVVDEPEDTEVSDEFKALGRVELAIYTGQFTRDESSGIDLLLVGDINQKQLQKFIDDLEKKESKEIRYTAMPLKEYEYRLQINDRFLSNILSAKSQVAVDRKKVLSKNKEPIFAESTKN